MKLADDRRAITRASGIVILIVIVVGVLGSSVVLQATKILQNPLGQLIIGSAGAPASTFTLAITDSTGQVHQYGATTIAPLSVQVNGYTVTVVTADLFATPTFTGSPSSAAISWSCTFTSTSPTVNIPAASGTYNVPAPIPASGSAIHFIGPNTLGQDVCQTFNVVLLSVGSAGTYTLTATASVTFTATFPDGTTSAKTATATAVLTYAYSAGSVSALTVTASSGAS